MDLRYDKTNEELAKELANCLENAEGGSDEEREYWELEARFYELIIVAKEKSIHRSEALLQESEALFGKRIALNISKDHSRAMLEASLLMLEWLLEE